MEDKDRLAITGNDDRVMEVLQAILAVYGGERHREHINNIIFRWFNNFYYSPSKNS